MICSRRFVSELAIYQLKIEVSEIFCEIIHVVADFLVGDTGVDLCCLDICVAEHLAHRFDGYTLAECHSGCEGVARQMEREVLLDAADVGNLLQITVEFLIGDDRQKLTIEILAFILFSILIAGGSSGTVTFVLVF